MILSSFELHLLALSCLLGRRTLSATLATCAEKCLERLCHLPAWRWAKTLLTRADTSLWRQDVEFIASVYNLFLRREQIRAVEACVSNFHSSPGLYAGIASLSCVDLMGAALISGDVNSVREVLRKKGLDLPIRNAMRRM